MKKEKPHVTTELFLSRFPGGDAGRRGRERGGVEVQLWVAIALLGCAISPCWNRWE